MNFDHLTAGATSAPLSSSSTTKAGDNNDQN